MTQTQKMHGIGFVATLHSGSTERYSPIKGIISALSLPPDLLPFVEVTRLCVHGTKEIVLANPPVRKIGSSHSEMPSIAVEKGDKISLTWIVKKTPELTMSLLDFESAPSDFAAMLTILSNELERGNEQ